MKIEIFQITTRIRRGPSGPTNPQIGYRKYPIHRNNLNYTGEHCALYEESFERDEDDVQSSDDEEVQLLNESESETLTAVSQANRTSTQTRQAVKDSRTTIGPLPKSSRESERRCFLCRCPHLARDSPDRNKPTSRGFEGSGRQNEWQERQRQRRILGVVTMATAFAVSAEPDIEFVSNGAKKRGFIESCDDYSPFDAYAPSEQLCTEKASLSDWSQWASPSDRNPFITLARKHELPAKESFSLPNWTLPLFILWTVAMNDLCSTTDLSPLMTAHRVKSSTA